MPDEVENGGESVETETNPTAESTTAIVDSEVPETAEFKDAWANAFGDADSDGNATDPSDTSEAPKPDATAETAETEAAKDEETDADEKPVDDKGEKGAKPDAKALAQEKADKALIASLPSTLRAAAQRAGYTDADLAKDITDLGEERVSATLERWHGGFNELSSRLSQLGRANQPPAQQQQQQTQTQQPAATNALDALFEPANLAKFQANYGNELVEQVLKPLMAELQPLREIRAEWEAGQRTALQQEISSVFDGIGDEYSPLYGKGGMEQITPEAREQRMAVLREADLIMAGAERSGVAMSTKEAIARAHALHTAPRRAEFERKALRQKIQKRAGSITHRPTQRRTPSTVADGARKSEASAIESVGRREAELGINFFED